MPDSVRAADDGQLARTGIVRTASQLLVDRLQGCSINVYDYFTVPGNWLAKFLASWSLSELTQNRGIHGSSASKDCAGTLYALRVGSHSAIHFLMLSSTKEWA